MKNNTMPQGQTIWRSFYITATDWHLLSICTDITQLPQKHRRHNSAQFYQCTILYHIVLHFQRVHKETHTDTHLGWWKHGSLLLLVVLRLTESHWFSVSNLGHFKLILSWGFDHLTQLLWTTFNALTIEEECFSAEERLGFSSQRKLKFSSFTFSALLC